MGFKASKFQYNKIKILWSSYGVVFKLFYWTLAVMEILLWRIFQKVTYSKVSTNLKLVRITLHQTKVIESRNWHVVFIPWCTPFDSQLAHLSNVKGHVSWGRQSKCMASLIPEVWKNVLIHPQIPICVGQIGFLCEFFEGIFLQLTYW